MLSIDAIKQYQKIYKDCFGEEISEEQAELSGSRLVELFRVILQPDPLNSSPIANKGNHNQS